MNIDEIINTAIANAGERIDGTGLFILEANAEKDMFRVRPAEEVFTDNVLTFACKVNTGYTFLGMYTTEVAAWDMAETLKTNTRDKNGNSLFLSY